MDVGLHPLVPNVPLPVAAAMPPAAAGPAAGARAGGLPAAAAAGTGLLIPSPIGFGWCRADELPAGAHPVAGPVGDGEDGAPRLLYVRDQPACRFERNVFHCAPFRSRDAHGRLLTHKLEPAGVGLVEGVERGELFRLQLPYVLRTPPGMDSLLLPPLHRPGPLAVAPRLVETDWYAGPLELILRRPAGSVHVAAGDVVAQLVLLYREARQAALRVLAAGSAAARALQDDVVRWQVQHGGDRSAYERLARVPLRGSA